MKDLRALVGAVAFGVALTVLGMLAILGAQRDSRESAAEAVAAPSAPSASCPSGAAAQPTACAEVHASFRREAQSVEPSAKLPRIVPDRPPMP